MSKEGSLKATVVVDFGGGEDSSSLIRVELDPDLNVDAEGEFKSVFNEGDEIYIAIHKLVPSVTINEILTTTGDIHLVEIDRISLRKEKGIFVYEGAKVELNYVPYSRPNFMWFGPGPNTVSVTGRSVEVSDYPHIGDVSYLIKTDIYRYTPVSSLNFIDDQYLVGLVIKGEKL